MQDLEQYPVPVPKRGMNTRSPADQLAPSEAQKLKNFYFRSESEMVQRGATEVLANAKEGGTSPDNMHYWAKEEVLIISYQGKVYQYDPTADTWTAIADYSASVSEVGICDFGVGDANKVYLAHKLLTSWDGTSTNDITGASIPAPTRVFSRYDQLYALGDLPDNPATLYASDTLDATTWDAGNAFSLSVGGGEGAVLKDAIKAGEGGSADFAGESNIYLFTGGNAPAIWRLTGYDGSTRTLRAIHSGLVPVVGTAAAIKSTGLFLADSGVYDIGQLASQESLNERPVSDTVNDQITQLSGIVNAQYIPEMGGYLLCDESSEVWVANLAVSPRTWTKFDFDSWPVSAFARGGGEIYMAGSSKVWKLKPYQNDNSVEMVWDTGRMRFGDRSVGGIIKGISCGIENCGADEVEARFDADGNGWRPYTPMTRDVQQIGTGYDRTCAVGLRFTDPYRRVRLRGMTLYLEKQSRRLA